MVLQENQQFTSQWFEGIVTVQSVDEENNNLEVYIDRGNGNGHFEEWNLQHTVWGLNVEIIKYVGLELRARDGL